MTLNVIILRVGTTLSEKVIFFNAIYVIPPVLAYCPNVYTVIKGGKVGLLEEFSLG